MVTITLNKNESVFDWVQIAKGLGIIFVVIGHFCPNTAPYYWQSLRDIIYVFHMPLFFFLSGFLFKYEKYQYLEMVKKKINRLLFPFLFIAILFLVLKYLIGYFFTLDYPVELRSVYALLYDPVNSYMPLLWFIYTLFLIFLIYPLFRKVLKSNSLILLLFLLFNVLFGNNFIVIGPVLIYMPYFIVGVFFWEKKDMASKLISGKPFICLISLMFFILTFWFFDIFNLTGKFYYVRIFISGIFGVFFIANISASIDSIPRVKWLKIILLKLGFYSMTIYLFHTLFASSVRILFYQVLVELQVGFELVAFCMVSAGIVFPLILEKFVLRKISFTRKYILGLT